MTTASTHFRASSLLGCAAAVALLTLTSVSRAGNGLNDPGYGTESAGLAGADLALARDTGAFNTNPAGLMHTQREVFGALLEPYLYTSQKHRDELGNNSGPDNTVGVLMGGGYARRLKDRNVVVGLGLLAQGGLGFVYEDFQTPFEGRRDDLSSLLGAFKVAPGVAWQVNDQWSIGVVLGVVYSTLRQKVFPRISTADFSGYRVDSMSGVSVNGRVGVQYRPHPDWVIGAAYGSKAPIRLEGGTVRVNNSAQEGGTVVNYRDARQTGLAFAQELGVGVFHRLNSRWGIEADVNWLDWSSALSSTRLTATRPDDDSAAEEFVVVSPLRWRDQIIGAVGVTYQWTPSTELRAGASYGRNPVPKETVSPTFAAVAESTLAAGFAHQVGPRWTLAGTTLYQPDVTVRYDSALTGRSSERWGITVLYLSLTRRW